MELDNICKEWLGTKLEHKIYKATNMTCIQKTNVHVSKVGKL